MLGCEGSCETGITYFYLILLHKVESIARPEFLFMLSGQFLHQLELPAKRNTDIRFQIVHLPIKLLLLFFSLLLFLLSLDNIGCANHSNPDIGGPQATHVICAIACVQDAAAG